MARAKVTTAHLDKSLDIIYKSDWEERRLDKDYWLLGESLQASQKVQAIWLGRIENAHKIPRSKWEPYALEVYVISKTDSDGRELKEPKTVRDALACQTFKTFEELETAYNAYIARFMGLPPGKLSVGKSDPTPEPVPKEPEYSEDDDEDDPDDYIEKAVSAESEKPKYDIPSAAEADTVSGGIGGDW
jgi:hypothetical protein